jgi:hypothetical protein
MQSIWWLVNDKTRMLDRFVWVLYLDDDIFVDVPVLMSFLHGIPSHVPMLVSSIWHNPPWDAPRNWRGWNDELCPKPQA